MASEVQRAIGVVSSKDYAAHRGVSPAYISKLKKLGKLAEPAVLADGRINVTLADQMLGTSTLFEPPAAAEPSPSAPNYAVERARREAAQRERQEIELAEKKKLIRSARDVDRTTFDAFRQARDNLLAIAPRVAEDLAAETSPRVVAHVLTQAITRVLSDLSNSLDAEIAASQETMEDERAA